MYPPGATYGRHRDRFRDDYARVLSCVLYLNEGWQPGDGGALRLHLDDGDALDVAPVGGTLVAFMSESFDHEVPPAKRTRIALTGWFRRRARSQRPGGGTRPGPTPPRARARRRWRSSPPELRLALFEEGLHALDPVLGRHRELVQAALLVEPGR